MGHGHASRVDQSEPSLLRPSREAGRVESWTVEATDELEDFLVKWIESGAEGWEASAPMRPERE